MSLNKWDGAFLRDRDVHVHRQVEVVEEVIEVVVDADEVAVVLGD